LEARVETGSRFVSTALASGAITPEEYEIVSKDLGLRGIKTVDDIPSESELPRGNYLHQIERIAGQTNNLHAALDSLVRSESAGIAGSIERGKRTILRKVFNKEPMRENDILSVYLSNARALNDLYFMVFAYSYNVLRKTEKHIQSDYVFRKANYNTEQSLLSSIGGMKEKYAELEESLKGVPRESLGMELVRLRQIKSDIDRMSLDAAGRRTAVNFINQEERFLEAAHKNTYDSTVSFFKLYTTACHYVRSLVAFIEHYKAALYQYTSTSVLENHWNVCSRLLYRMDDIMYVSSSLLNGLGMRAGPETLVSNRLMPHLSEAEGAETSIQGPGVSELKRSIGDLGVLGGESFAVGKSGIPRGYR